MLNWANNSWPSWHLILISLPSLEVSGTLYWTWLSYRFQILTVFHFVKGIGRDYMEDTPQWMASFLSLFWYLLNAIKIDSCHQSKLAFCLWLFLYLTIIYIQSHHILHQTINIVIQVHLPKGIFVMLVFLYQLCFVMFFLNNSWRSILIDYLYSVKLLLELF